MKRPIFVRPISDAERETLEAGLRSPDAFTLRRCQILIASDRGENAYQIARSLGCNPQTARNAIHAFNQKGGSRGRFGKAPNVRTPFTGPSRVPNRPRLCASFCTTNPGSSAKTRVCGRWISPRR
jgi:DNA-binding CsgD family transcriptional regulator